MTFFKLVKIPINIKKYDDFTNEFESNNCINPMNIIIEMIKQLSKLQHIYIFNIPYIIKSNIGIPINNPKSQRISYIKLCAYIPSE